MLTKMVLRPAEVENSPMIGCGLENSRCVPSITDLPPFDDSHLPPLSKENDRTLRPQNIMTQEQCSGKPKNQQSSKCKIKDYGHEMFGRLIKVILRLGAYEGYNENNEIKCQDGSFLPSSNIEVLLVQALTPGNPVKGEEEFIELLHSANVSPALIINKNIKHRLENLYKQNKQNDENSTPKVGPSGVNKRIFLKPRLRKRNLTAAPGVRFPQSVTCSKRKKDDTMPILSRFDANDKRWEGDSE